MNPLKIVYYGLLGSNLIALLVSYRKLQKKHLVFVPIILIALATQLAAEALQAKGINHYFLFHFYIPAEFILLSIYYSYIFSSAGARWLLVISNLILIMFCIRYYYMGSSLNDADYSNFVMESVFVSICVVCFFIQLFRNEEMVALSRYADFWINAGNLLFYAGLPFVMGLHFALNNTNPKLAEAFLNLNYYLNLLLYLFYLIAFIWANRSLSK